MHVLFLTEQNFLDSDFSEIKNCGGFCDPFSEKKTVYKDVLRGKILAKKNH